MTSATPPTDSPQATNAPSSAETPIPALPAVGTLLGIYQLHSLLGEGGMGVVYLAEHAKLERKVALKLLRPELARDPAIAKRFLAEAHAVNRIEHPNVVEITDIVEEAYSYYIMELLHGDSLAKLQSGQALLPLPRVLDVAAQLASGLAAVHEAEIVHCDVKPGNVFLETRDGKETVKLLDFGIAKLPGDAPIPAATSLKDRTAQDLVATPAYMSPEQAENGPVTYKSDIYSFGVLLYEALCGHLPFEADTVEDMVLKHLSSSVEAPSKRVDAGRGISQALDELVMQCLQKKPEDRPTSMQEIELRLTRVRNDIHPPLSRGTALRAFALRQWTERRLIVLGAALLLIVVAIGIAISALFATHAKPEPVVPPAATVTPAVAAPAVPDKKAPVPTVTIAFATTPEGAVVRSESGKLLGVTPVRVSVPKTAHPVRFVFELAGYASAIKKIVPADDMHVSAQLVPLAAGGTKAKAPTKKKPAGH